MRIKLRCPHCGDWFTLSLGIENGEAESRESDEQTEEADADDEPARPHARAPRGRLIGAVCAAAAAVIIIWAVAALRSDRRGETGAPDEVSARPAAARVEADRDQRSPGDSEVSSSAPSAIDLSPAEAGESGVDDHGEEVARDVDEITGGERESTGGVDEVAGAEDQAAGEGGEPGVGEGDAPPADADAIDAEPAVAGATSTGTADAEVASSDAELPVSTSPAALDREILELEIVASDRCWIRVKADGVVVADATLGEGERRSWRADGFFDIDVGAGSAVRLHLNGEDLGPAGADARVVEGLRVTRDGIRAR